MLAERRLKIARQDQEPNQSNALGPSNGKISQKKVSGDVVDAVSEISSNNLLAPPPTGYYNNSRAGADGTTTTVSEALTFSINGVI